MSSINISLRVLGKKIIVKFFHSIDKLITCDSGSDIAFKPINQNIMTNIRNSTNED